MKARFGGFVMRAPSHATREFYELLGVPFGREKHGGGPWHLAHVATGSVLEIYPDELPADTIIIFVSDLVETVKRMTHTEPNPKITSYSLADPDGRTVLLMKEKS